MRHNFTANISAGIRHQDYDEADLSDSNDFTGFVARGGATYKFTEDDVFDLLVERNIYESTFSNMNYYIVNHVGLNYTHFFTKKITSRLFGYYQLNHYPDEATVGTKTAKREDVISGGGVALRYDLNKMVSFEIAYEHKERDSEFNTYDYIDDMVTIRGAIGF